MEPVVVADAYTMVKWLIPEPHSQQAAILRDNHPTSEIKATAPKTAIIEFANTMRKYVVRGLITRRDTLQALNPLQAIEVNHIDIEGELLAKALNTTPFKAEIAAHYQSEEARLAAAYAKAAGCTTHPRLCGQGKLKDRCLAMIMEPWHLATRLHPT